MTADGLTAYDEDLSLEGSEKTPDDEKKGGVNINIVL